MTATIAWISIAPVKGMRMLDLTEVEITADGAVGDREFFMVDHERAMINGKRLGPLQQIVPEYSVDGGVRKLSLSFPDGRAATGEVQTGEPEDITFYGMPFRARPVLGEFSELISAHCGQELRLMARPTDRPAVDRGEWGGVTMLSRASLQRLGEAAAESGEGDGQGSVDQRRFRMTFGVDGVEPHEEDDWIDDLVKVGQAEVQVLDRVGRCAVTTRDPERGEVDMKTLHHIRSYREDVVSNEPLPFGVYASVRKPGRVRIGDPVGPTDRHDYAGS